MQENNPGYSLGVKGNLIRASFFGEWGAGLDLQFMSELGEKMQQMRGKPWALYVDMRRWTLPKIVVETTQPAKTGLDRRNQVAECWVVNDLEQGTFLLPLIRQTNMAFERCFTVEAATQWLAHKGFTM